MATEITEQSLQFTTLTSRQMWGNCERIPENIPNNAIGTLADPILKIFNATGNRVQLVAYGQRPVTFVDATPERKIFANEINQVIWANCQDLFESNSDRARVRESARGEWKNIGDIAPKIIECFLRAENHVVGISKDYATNLVAFAIAIARNPDLLGETVFQVGFGGSDGPTPARLPAYAFPPLQIVEQLQHFYRERDDWALNRRQQIEARNKGISQGSPLPILTEDQIKETRTQFGIATRMPKVRLFFADHAAMAINKGKSFDNTIDARTKFNIALLKEELRVLFPGLEGAIEYPRDIYTSDPREAFYWQHQYLQSLLYGLASGEEDILPHRAKSALESLKVTGKKKAVADGLQEHKAEQLALSAAVAYGAMHVLVFQDRTQLPFIPTLEGIHDKPQINISFGGESEMRFNALRTFLSYASSPQGYKTFLEGEQKTAPAEARQIIRQQIEVVNQMLGEGQHNTRRAHFGEWDSTAQLPNLSILLEVAIGGTAPVYYHEDGIDLGHRHTAITADMRHRSDEIEAHVRTARSRAEELIAANDGSSRARRKHFERILDDYAVLTKTRRQRGIGNMSFDLR